MSGLSDLGRKVRLLPLTIALAALLLTVRLGDLWVGLTADEGIAISPGASVALAAGDNQAEEKKTEGEDVAALPEGAPPVEGPPEYTDAEIELLQDLAKRREELDKREREIELRAGLLAAAEKRIDAKIRKLEGLHETVAGLLGAYEEKEAAKLKSLVKIYETMKPKDAARIWEKLDLAVILEVIERMREAKSAAILARMSAETARRITTELAARRKLPEIEG